MPVQEILTVASLTKLLQPLVKDFYSLAKKAGIRGLKRWEQANFSNRLAKQIKLIDQVRTIWKPEGPISLQEFFHPPKVLVNKKPKTISRIGDLPGNAILIEGIVGQGKSVFLRSLAIEELTQNDGKWIPMLLELKDLSQKTDLRSALLKQLDSYGVDADDETLNYFLSSGKFSLLLDGFDELEEQIVKETYIELEYLCKKFPELRVVVTSRPGHEIQKSTTFQTLKIAPLTSPEYSAFMDRLGVDAKKSLDIRKAIKDSPTKISDLITTPLMLTLVVLVYESESNIPETLPEFFETLFQVVFTKHDRQKANFNRKHKTGLSEKKLQKLFETFSFMSLQKGNSRTLTDSQFEEIFEIARESEGVECEANEFRHDITKSACLMLEDGIDSITYLHKSLLEYFAAAFVKRLTDENAEMFYGMAAGKHGPWQEVLVFLRSIDGIRYARYYTLPVIDKHRSEILLPCAQADEKKLVEKMTSLSGGMSVLYYKNIDTDDFRVRMAFGGTPIVGDEIGDFSTLLLTESYNSLPSPIKNFIEEFGPIDMGHGADDRIEIKNYLVFKKIGGEKIKSILGIFETRINAAEAAAKLVVAKEEKKKLLFVKS